MQQLHTLLFNKDQDVIYAQPSPAFIKRFWPFLHWFDNSFREEPWFCQERVVLVPNPKKPWVFSNLKTFVPVARLLSYDPPSGDVKQSLALSHHAKVGVPEDLGEEFVVIEVHAFQAIYAIQLAGNLMVVLRHLLANTNIVVPELVTRATDGLAHFDVTTCLD